MGVEHNDSRYHRRTEKYEPHFEHSTSDLSASLWIAVTGYYAQRWAHYTSTITSSSPLNSGIFLDAMERSACARRRRRRRRAKEGRWEVYIHPVFTIILYLPDFTRVVSVHHHQTKLLNHYLKLKVCFGAPKRTRYSSHRACYPSTTLLSLFCLSAELLNERWAYFLGRTAFLSLAAGLDGSITAHHCQSCQL